MRVSVLLSTFVLALTAAATFVPAPRPGGVAPRTNAEALRRGLPPLKARVCDAACKAQRLARRSKPSHTSLPARSVQFRKTCVGETYSFSGTTAIMSATCYDSFGQSFSTTLDLNDCISPNKGTLTCMPGDFTTSGGCTGCYVDGETMYCMCPNSKGVPTKASINLNACIGNLEGSLYCNKHA